MAVAKRTRSLTIIAARAGAGNDTLYRPEYAERAYNLCLLGATDKDLAGVFGVGTTTINVWAKQHEDFGTALAIGGVHADAQVAASMFKRATGYDVIEVHPIKVKTGQYTEKVEMVEVKRHIAADPMAGKFWLTNRQKALWQDASKIEHSGSIDTSAKPVDEMSDDELFAAIEEAKRTFQISENVVDLIDVNQTLSDLGFE